VLSRCRAVVLRFGITKIAYPRCISGTLETESALGVLKLFGYVASPMGRRRFVHKGDSPDA
jgi:hypothetical protein